MGMSGLYRDVMGIDRGQPSIGKVDGSSSDEFVVDNEGWKEYDCANKATF